MSNSPQKNSSEIEQTYSTIDSWMEHNLKKVEYSEFVQTGHEKIEVSKKTWQNYRLGKTEPPLCKLKLIVEMFDDPGFNLYTIKPDYV